MGCNSITIRTSCAGVDCYNRHHRQAFEDFLDETGYDAMPGAHTDKGFEVIFDSVPHAEEADRALSRMGLIIEY